MREPRDSLYEHDPPSLASRLGVGCGVGCVVVVLLGGALGLAVGGYQRFAEWDDAEVADDPGIAPDSPEQPQPGAGAGPVGPPPAQPAASTMRERYRPGPFVEVQSMVESGRLMPALTNPGAPVTQAMRTPWVVPGSEPRPQPMPAPAAGGPQIQHGPAEPVAQPLAVLPRTPTRASVRAQDAAGGTAISGYLVDFEGYPGHFWLPAMAPTELGVVQAGGSEGATVYFAIQSPVQPNGVSLQPGQTFRVRMRIAAVDSSGRASAPISRLLEVMSVGAGDVEVTLTMGEATDMDLYVTDPTGQQIYYGNRDSSSGGHLDLDANAACSSNMGVNNEHIFWRAGSAPVGTYRVNVAHWRSCIDGRAVSYRLTVRACGETVVLTGSFTGQGDGQTCRVATPDTRTWCQEALLFDMPGCAP